MTSKLNLDQNVIASARNHAKNIAESMQEFINAHTTVSTERTVLRLLGVDGVDDVERPLPNVLVDAIKDGGGLPKGIAYWIGNAIIKTGKTPQEIADAVSLGELDIMKLEPVSMEEARRRYGFTDFRVSSLGIGGGNEAEGYPGSVPGLGVKSGNPDYERYEAKYLKAVEAHLKEKGWLKDAYVYCFDEPRRSADERSRICTSSLRPATSMKTSTRQKLLPARARTSSPSSERPRSPCWTTFPTAPPPKVSAVPMQRRKTSAS